MIHGPSNVQFRPFLVILNHNSQISREATRVEVRKYKYEASSSLVLLLGSIAKIDDSQSLRAQLRRKTDAKIQVTL